MLIYCGLFQNFKLEEIRIEMHLMFKKRVKKDNS